MWARKKNHRETQRAQEITTLTHRHTHKQKTNRPCDSSFGETLLRVDRVCRSGTPGIPGGVKDRVADTPAQGYIEITGRGWIHVGESGSTQGEGGGGGHWKSSCLARIPGWLSSIAFWFISSS